jgi:hypothetical protein
MPHQADRATSRSQPTLIVSGLAISLPQAATLARWMPTGEDVAATKWP